MQPDLWSLYYHMLRSRLFEEAIANFWEEGLISGEMHLGNGEEGVIAGVVDHLREGDAMALDHRGTSAFLIRGVDPVAMLREFLGYSDGLCSGMGGHMHLFSQKYLAASSGIVGASGPAAAGFALAALHLRPKTVCVAFFGEGAMNQGMLLESMNLAVVWKLPVLFVCKDNSWAITTRSLGVTGGNLLDRARSFGLPANKVDSSNVEEVWHASGNALDRSRAGKGPSFLLARCTHHEGHFMGDPLLRVARHPVKEMKKISGPMLQSASRLKGALPHKRAASLGAITGLIGRTFKENALKQNDPLKRARQKLKSDKKRLQELEEETIQEIRKIVEIAVKNNDIG